MYSTLLCKALTVKKIGVLCVYSNQFSKLSKSLLNYANLEGKGKFPVRYVCKIFCSF